MSETLGAHNSLLSLAVSLGRTFCQVRRVNKLWNVCFVVNDWGRQHENDQ